MPRLMEMQQHYDQVQFVGVNLDLKAETTRSFVAERNIAWPQISAPGWGDENELLKLFGVTALPSIWLIGPDGEVLARDLRVEELATALERVTANDSAAP